MKKHHLLFIAALAINIQTFSQEIRKTIDLSGTWEFKIDNNQVGIGEKWFNQTLNSKVMLPGTMDENKQGNTTNEVTDMHLNRVYSYTGAAWYRKEFNILTDWDSKYIELFLERTKVTKVWIDSIYWGTSNNIFVPQRYILTGLKPGKHTLSVMVDNTESLVPVAGSHAYSDDTQTNWNGILGKIEIEAFNITHIEKLAIIPDVKNKQAILKLSISNPDDAIQNITFSVKARSWNTSKVDSINLQDFGANLVKGNNELTFKYQIGDKMQLWSEFDPTLYKIEIRIYNESKIIDSYSTSFGMREFKTNGKQFTINGTTIFLRGKHEAGVFPLTGHPPMDTAGWIRVFKIAKTYGINHYRFHSWTPPAAAFAAADVCGIYMQPELPNWWAIDLKKPEQVSFNLKEGKLILDNYRNNASFVMMSMGNEIYQPREGMKMLVDTLRSYDSNLLYAQGSNNFGGAPAFAIGDDYWTTFRTSWERDDCSSDVRSSISFVDSKSGGVLNTSSPSTLYTYSKAIAESPIPVIGHEIGEYQVYPNYDEMKKYTGVLKPLNFGIFKSALAKEGMANQAYDFFKASGALAVICYRAEIENAFRTPNFGGFHLLDLEDYPGQGTALVGILDAFMDSKGLITPDSFRHFCNHTVILLNMKKYCWSADENFSGTLQVANYSGKDYLGKSISWTISDAQNQKVLFQGKTNVQDVINGKINSLGELTQSLGKVETASKLIVSLALDGSAIENSYNIWVYPAAVKPAPPSAITVASILNDSIFKKFENGGKVLYFPENALDSANSVPGQFITEFWNYKMFTGFANQNKKGWSPGTMGILTNPVHPIFTNFPTDFYTNWQWWNIIKNSRPSILSTTDSLYKPIVQVIDNINRNYKLGLIYEYKVGKGKLLICNASLLKIQDKPEAKQLYYSILEYMKTDKFKPEIEITTDTLKSFFKVETSGNKK